MLRASLKKIKSARKPQIALGIAGSIILLVAVYIAQMPGSQTEPPRRQLELRTGVYQLEVVDNPASQQLGLSGRERLVYQTGMLFTYNQTDERCMWMKDMKFAIDIVWLDSHKRISKLAAGVEPKTYPTLFCAQAQYVIELQNGAIEFNGLSTGQSVQF